MAAERYNHGFLTTSLRMIVRAEDRPMVVRSFWVCNTGGSNTTWNLQHVPADEDPSNEHSLIFETIMRSKITDRYESPIFLLPGDELHALAAVSNVVTLTFYLQPYDEWVRTH